MSPFSDLFPLWRRTPCVLSPFLLSLSSFTLHLEGAAARGLHMLLLLLLPIFSLSCSSLHAEPVSFTSYSAIQAIFRVVMACNAVGGIKIALRQGWGVPHIKVYTYLITSIRLIHVGRC